MDRAAPFRNEGKRVASKSAGHLRRVVLELGVRICAIRRQGEPWRGPERPRKFEAVDPRLAAVGVDARVVDDLEQLNVLPVDVVCRQLNGTETRIGGFR